MTDTAISMKVTGLMVDPLTNSPIVILKSEDGERLLPIWIGPFEAQAIAMKRDEVEPPRPMTHDLLASALGSLGCQVEKIVIHELRGNTFVASLHVVTSSEPHEIDSRPSDAIALALRVDAPILVELQVLEQSSVGEYEAGDEETRLKSWFDSLDPGDLSKYHM